MLRLAPVFLIVALIAGVVGLTALKIQIEQDFGTVEDSRPLW